MNLAGIKRIIELTNQVEALRARVAELASKSRRCVQRRAAISLCCRKALLLSSGSLAGSNPTNSQDRAYRVV